MEWRTPRTHLGAQTHPAPSSTNAGAVPASLSSLPTLRALNLARNNFTGGFQGPLGPRVVWINASDCGLTGGLPGLPQRIMQADFAGNGLSGGLETDLRQLTRLVLLDVAGNQLSGKLQGRWGWVHAGCCDCSHQADGWARAVALTLRGQWELHETTHTMRTRAHTRTCTHTHTHTHTHARFPLLPLQASPPPSSTFTLKAIPSPGCFRRHRR